MRDQSKYYRYHVETAIDYHFNTNRRCYSVSNKKLQLQIWFGKRMKICIKYRTAICVSAVYLNFTQGLKTSMMSSKFQVRILKENIYSIFATSISEYGTGIFVENVD